MKFIFWLTLEGLAIGLSTMSLFAFGFQLMFLVTNHPANNPATLGLAVVGLVASYQFIKWSVKGAVRNAWVI